METSSFYGLIQSSGSNEQKWQVDGHHTIILCVAKHRQT